MKNEKTKKNGSNEMFDSFVEDVFSNEIRTDIIYTYKKGGGCKGWWKLCSWRNC